MYYSYTDKKNSSKLKLKLNISMPFTKYCVLFLFSIISTLY